jgi:hypothetical protein
MDFGRFMTGFLVLAGIGELPILLPPGLATTYVEQSLPGQYHHSLKLVSHDCDDSVAVTVRWLSIIPT